MNNTHGEFKWFSYLSCLSHDNLRTWKIYKPSFQSLFHFFIGIPFQTELKTYFWWKIFSLNFVIFSRFQSSSHEQSVEIMKLITKSQGHQQFSIFFLAPLISIKKFFIQTSKFLIGLILRNKSFFTYFIFTFNVLQISDRFIITRLFSTKLLLSDLFIFSVLYF